MITKIELEKNILDLDYKRNLQLLNIVLITGLGIIFTYIGALIVSLEKYISYSLLLVVVISVTIYLYKRIDENLKEISENIQKLAG
ncbi:MAG: hypothetical protein AABX65_03630 [Nanoarchaeota archaeon]